MATADATVKAVLNHLLQNGGGISTIVDEWREGSEWYRVWSNGLIEQGGFVPTQVQSNISFNTAFTSTNYSFLVCTICTKSGEDGSWASRELAGNRTTTSTKCFTDSWGGDNGRHGSWFACGY